MKAIKFRAWDKDNRRMIDVKAIDWDDKGNIISINYPEGKLYPNEDYGDHIILMQFTGLYDKNGKEIYEGDIIELTENQTIYFGSEEYPCRKRQVVGFYQGAFMTGRRFLDYYDTYLWILLSEVKVIGNVFENANLLEK